MARSRQAVGGCGAAATGCNAGAKGAEPLRPAPARPAGQVQALDAPESGKFAPVPGLSPEPETEPERSGAEPPLPGPFGGSGCGGGTAAQKVANAIVFNKVFARELLARHFQMLFEVQCEAERAPTKRTPGIDAKQAEQAASGAIRFGVAQSLHPIIDPEVRVYYNPVTEKTDLSSIADSDDGDHVEYMLDRWKESVEDTLPLFEHMVRYRNTVIYAKLLLSRRDRELGVGAFGQKIEEEEAFADLVAAAADPDAGAAPAASADGGAAPSPEPEPMALAAPLVPSVSIGVEAADMGTSDEPADKRARAPAKNRNDLDSYSEKAKGAVNADDFKDDRGRTRTRRPRPQQTEAQKLRNKQLSKAKKKREAPFLYRLYVKPRTARNPPASNGRVDKKGPEDNPLYSKQQRERSSSITSAALS